MSAMIGVVEQLAQGSAALLTPLIGYLIATDYHRRYMSSQQDREHELFKRRQRVYTRLTSILAEIIACRIGQAPKTAEELSGLLAEGSFLFSADLAAELDIVSERAFEYMELNHELKELGPDDTEERRNEITATLRDRRRWFLDTRRRLAPLFHEEMRKHHNRIVH